jgi:predicted transcriptional regulator
MDDPIRRPEEILAYRSLRRILASKPEALWTVASADSVLTAQQMMADKDIGLVVVMEGSKLAGVLSERDCARRVLLARKSPESTPVADIMVRNVVTIDAEHTFADCLRLIAQAQHSSPAGRRQWQGDCRCFDPGFVERGGRAQREDY